MFSPDCIPASLGVLSIANPVQFSSWQIFERLQHRADPKVLEEQQQAINERVRAIYEKSQTRLGELVCCSDTGSTWTLLTLMGIRSIRTLLYHVPSRQSRSSTDAIRVGVS